VWGEQYVLANCASGRERISDAKIPVEPNLCESVGWNAVDGILIFHPKPVGKQEQEQERMP
jgi:hypothetical protein